MSGASVSSLGYFSEKSKHSVPRSSTPDNLLYFSKGKSMNPYPLYKQKIRALLKPPDYSKNPPKFISDREPRSEFEKKEASTQVKLLKKTFNTMYQRFNSYNRTLTVLKSEALRVNALRTVGESDLSQLQARIDSLQHEENRMLSKINDEFNNNLSSKHVRERLQQTLMCLEGKNQYLRDQIRLKDFLIESEHWRKIKTLENKFTKKQAFTQLNKAVQLDIKDWSQDLAILKEDIISREKIHELRKTRLKKYEEIAETAANEERDLRNNNMREAVLANILWAKHLDSKFSYETKKYERIENAFQKIKASTLVITCDEILSRFLLKEVRLKELVGMLNSNRDKCLDYLRKNDDVEAKIDRLLLVQRNYPEANITALKNQIHCKMNSIKVEKSRLRRVRLCFDLVNDWAAKNLSKLLGIKVEKELKLFEKFTILSKGIKININFVKTPAFLTEL